MTNNICPGHSVSYINILPHSLTMLNTTNTEFSFIEMWFSKPIEIEDNVNMKLIIR